MKKQQGKISLMMFMAILSIVMAGMKLGGVLTLSWLWVFAPLFVVPVLVFMICAVVGLAFVFAFSVAVWKIKQS